MSAPTPNANTFWSTQDTWWSRVSSEGHLRAKGAFYDTARNPGRKAAAWGRYRTHIPASKLPAGALIRVDPKLQRELTRFAERLNSNLLRILDQEVSPLAVTAFENWPVQSGLSKSLIALEFIVRDGGRALAVRINSRAPYTVYIKGPEGQPHRVYLDKPSREVAERAAQRFLDAAARED